MCTSLSGRALISCLFILTICSFLYSLLYSVFNEQVQAGFPALVGLDARVMLRRTAVLSASRNALSRILPLAACAAMVGLDARVMLRRTAVLSASRNALSRILPLAACAAMVGLDGLEPSTSRLSGARSSHLSYRP